MKIRHIILRILFFCLCMILFHSFSGLGQCLAQDHKELNRKEKHKNDSISISLIELYQKYISPVDGKECPSYPSCSNYCKQAIKRHGFIMGWIMTVDRLIHEGRHETEVSPFIFINGKRKIYDPVENNDFWWYKPKRSHYNKTPLNERR